jgi:sarcosine oxidase, subunit alpha
MPNHRLPPKETQVTDRTKEISFRFENQTVSAFAGDTIASALYAAGVRVFSRSFKYHRPRGLLCVDGKCPNCLMNVNGCPNVRVCTEPATEGAEVRPQNAWPSLQHDFLSITQKFDWLLPIGFYYKTMIHPRFWHLAEPLLRRAAGLGVIDTQTKSRGHSEHVHEHCDVAIVGGGPAGLAAALALADEKLRVFVIDDQPELGGHLRFSTSAIPNANEFSGMRGQEIARHLNQRVQALPNVAVLNKATVFGCYEGRLLGIMQGDKLIHLRAKRLVLAPGRHEIPALFENNDLPGVFLSRGARRLVNLYGVLPGSRILVVAHNEEGTALARELMTYGDNVVGVVDNRPDAHPVSRSEDWKVPLFHGYQVTKALGRKQVDGALLGKVTGTQSAALTVAGSQAESQVKIDCDAICYTRAWQAQVGLPYQSGCEIHYDETREMFLARKIPQDVFVAGEVSGLGDFRTVMLSGQIAGLEAAKTLADGKAANLDSRLEEYQSTLRTLSKAGQSASAKAKLSPVNPSELKRQFVCLCEDITAKDLNYAIEEGFNEIETLKRYSTVTMGPCQGKMCSFNSIETCARSTGNGIAETGITTPRPPLLSVPLGLLAGPEHHPVKRTSMHYRHLALGATLMDLGEWKRPRHYTGPEEEWKAVRERVGVIDVSTLGKIELKGRDCGPLLDKVYTHTFSSLKVGKVRYGLICDEAGIILDDGTVSRLAEDHYFITTTTGNIDFVEQWLKWWLAGTELCAHVTNVTSGLAAINLAGPRAREVLQPLTDLDLSNGAFPYMSCARALVAGVPMRLLRIGFVGETGWEMHFPAEYGEEVWDLLLEVGKEYGIAPFGVEAQRILRLEKKHLIVGQDTDALSNPFAADMTWAVKFDKPDFIGKQSLLREREKGLREQLVGFVMRNGYLPEEGDPVVSDGKPVGRVTSSRYSPALKKNVGMAWVPNQMLQNASPLNILIDGRLEPADFHPSAFYDPQGERMKS